MFKCKKCEVMKPLDEFYSTPSGHRHVCKKCTTAATVEYQRKNPEKQRWKHMKHRYGITKEQYETMLEEQHSRCAICDQDLHTESVRHGKRPLNLAVVDHCHDSGEVRGILCHSCNVGIGHFYDNIEYLKKAIQYLEGEKENDDACGCVQEPAQELLFHPVSRRRELW